MTIENQMQNHMPVHPQVISFGPNDRPGLIIVDLIKGFTKVGAGPLAPLSPNKQIESMISEVSSISNLFHEKKQPIFFFMDSHHPGKAEPPYPPHCELGTEEAEIIDELKWLESSPHITFQEKECINGFIGAMNENGKNHFIDWVKNHNLTHLIFTGICTDVCVMDLVLISLSVRNRGFFGPDLKDIIVYEPACATYEIDQEMCAKYNLPDWSRHPQSLAHHLGLYFMASRGASIVNELYYTQNH